VLSPTDVVMRVEPIRIKCRRGLQLGVLRRMASWIPDAPAYRPECGASAERTQASLLLRKMELGQVQASVD
jgi:hypothetical protein